MRIVAIALLLCTGSPAAAQAITFEGANPPPKKATSDLDRMICQRVERTGSRLEVDKVCMTAAQWKEHRQTQREDVERVQRVVNQNPSG